MILPIEYCSAPGWDPKGMVAPSILVVDDDPALRKALTIFLKLQFMVFSASSVDEAMDVLDDSGADLVIMDYKMPGKDGLTGLREIRAKHSELPILMLTAYGDPKTFAKAMVLGAAECLKKPFELDDIFRSVGELMTSRGGHETKDAEKAPAGKKVDEMGPWSRN